MLEKIETDIGCFQTAVLTYIYFKRLSLCSFSIVLYASDPQYLWNISASIFFLVHHLLKALQSFHEQDIITSS